MPLKPDAIGNREIREQVAWYFREHPLFRAPTDWPPRLQTLLTRLEDGTGEEQKSPFGTA
jgi:hypothetical protein